MPRLAPPSAVQALSVMIRPGQDIPPELLVSVLADGGYERQDPVDEHGEFCLRGGILDIFPAGEDMPLRLEFVGDTVESLRRFDPDSQRSVESVDQFLLVPVRDFALDGLRATARRPASIIDYLGRAAMVVDRAGRCAGAGGTGICPRARRRSRSAPQARTQRRCCLPSNCWCRGPSSRRCSRAARRLQELSVDEAGEVTACRSPINRRRSSRAGSPTGWPTCGRRWRAPTPCCSSPGRAAAPSARWSSSATTTCGRPGPGTRTSERSRPAPCSSPTASSPAASACPTPALTVYAAADVFEEERRRGPASAPASDSRPPRSSPTSAI